MTTKKELKLTHAGMVVWDKSRTKILAISSCFRESTGRVRVDYLLPKGHIEDGETPKATAIREIAEELGVTVPESEVVTLGIAPPYDTTRWNEKTEKFEEETVTVMWFRGRAVQILPKREKFVEWIDPENLSYETHRIVARL